MRRLLLGSLMCLPSVAVAQQQPQVPAIRANAAATAGITAPPPSVSSMSGVTTATVPSGMPPSAHPLSPSAPLNSKEKFAATQAADWRNHNDRPSRGEDGVLKWVFGASLPSVVCAPLQTCDIALQPGETVNAIHVGDKVRWSVMPAVSGVGIERVTHLVVKPSDAGLVSSILVYTDKRLYSIKLISTQTQWTPMTAFNYPEAAQAAWASYGATMGTSTAAGSSWVGPRTGDVNFNYNVSGSAPWKPMRVYAQGGKTVIEFPHSMHYGSAPALVGLANDGGWFSSPTEQMVRYRIQGDRYIVDGIVEHAMLVTGVGSGQDKIDLRRQQ
jgi:type IV secretion system protein TrbG